MLARYTQIICFRQASTVYVVFVLAQKYASEHSQIHDKDMLGHVLQRVPSSVYLFAALLAVQHTRRVLKQLVTVFI